MIRIDTKERSYRRVSGAAAPAKVVSNLFFLQPEGFSKPAQSAVFHADSSLRLLRMEGV